MAKKQISLRLEQELIDGLKNEALLLSTNVTDLISIAMSQWLEGRKAKRATIRLITDYVASVGSEGVSDDTLKTLSPIIKELLKVNDDLHKEI